MPNQLFRISYPPEKNVPLTSEEIRILLYKYDEKFEYGVEEVECVVSRKIPLKKYVDGINTFPGGLYKQTKDIEQEAGDE